MKVAFITRSTLYKVPGGDTEQILQTAAGLRQSGVTVDLFLTNQPIDYNQYDLLHFFNITRPADILFHMNSADKPFAVSTILVDYTEYDRYHRKGLPGFLLRSVPDGVNEYLKTIARWILGRDSLQSKSYLWKGQQRSIREILRKADILLPNSESEYQQTQKQFGIEKKYAVVPNGIDTAVFSPNGFIEKENNLVLCAARIEGRKNHLNLIRAMNDTPYTLLLTGLPAPSQQRYYEECKKIASPNIVFCGRVPLETLVSYYKRAKVHVLPSWHETTGLSSLEAAALGCNITITDKGFTRDYFGNDAFYCDPGDPASIFNAIDQAAKSESRPALQKKILQYFTWEKAAATTLEAYKKILRA